MPAFGIAEISERLTLGVYRLSSRRLRLGDFWTLNGVSNVRCLPNDGQLIILPDETLPNPLRSPQKSILWPDAQW